MKKKNIVNIVSIISKKKKSISKKKSIYTTTYKKKGGGKTIVGKVYKNGCVYCDSMKEEWEKVKNNNQNIEFNDIEVNEDMDSRLKKINEKYSVNLIVEGFPTIYKIVNNKLSYYINPERSFSSIDKWLKS